MQNVSHENVVKLELFITEIMAAASVTTEPKHDSEDASSATAELERRKKIEAKMFKNQRRHYKKDTRYVLDLYTLTFDEDETVESVGKGFLSYLFCGEMATCGCPLCSTENAFFTKKCICCRHDHLQAGNDIQLVWRERKCQARRRQQRHLEPLLRRSRAFDQVQVAAQLRFSL